MGIEHFPNDPKSPEHKTTNIEEQTFVESKEPGEIGEDGNEVTDLQGKPKAHKHTFIDVKQKDYVNRKSKEAADEHNNDGVQHKEPKIGKPKADEHKKDDIRQKEPLLGKPNTD